MGEIIRDDALSRARQTKAAMATAIAAINHLIVAIDSALAAQGEFISISDARYILNVREKAVDVLQSTSSINVLNEGDVERACLDLLVFKALAERVPMMLELAVLRPTGLPPAQCEPVT